MRADRYTALPTPAGFSVIDEIAAKRKPDHARAVKVARLVRVRVWWL
jgi:hypothetical protein